jgi:dihydrofolate reductase
MSLDGFIAYDDNTPGALFDWYDAGDVEVANAGDLPPFHLTPQSAEYWRTWRAGLGALVVGRTLFDVTDGWRGTHPLDVPVVVLTHERPDGWNYPGSEHFRFATEGIEQAITLARELAGDKDVGVAAGTVAAQALEAGLLDAVAIDLVPVVLGTGRRYFGDRPLDTILLGDPELVVAAARVTHLVFPVPRP